MVPGQAQISAKKEEPGLSCYLRWAPSSAEARNGVQFEVSMVGVQRQSLSLCLSPSVISLTHTPELVLKGWGLGMQLNWKSTCLACTKPWVPSQRCQLGVQCQHLGGKGRRSTSKKEEKTKPRSHSWLYSEFRPTGPQREAEYTYGRVKISRAQDQVGSKVTRSGYRWHFRTGS